MGRRMTDPDYMPSPGDGDWRYRLVGDVGALKGQVRAMQKSQEQQWKKFDDMRDTLVEMNRKLDRVLSLDDRLHDVESGVADYRRDKVRLIGIVVGVALGTGAAAGVAGPWLLKLLMGGL
ncbi:MAG: hypothetical protein RJQ08_13650 [Salinisphaeraceae bacterium]